MKNNDRYIGLDYFRVLCMFAICAYHTIIHLTVNYGPLQSFLIEGPIFMTAFFMLSGFLLSLRYDFSEGVTGNSLVMFYKKRYSALIPLYWFCAVLFILFERQNTIKQIIMLVPVEMFGLQTFFTSLFWYSHIGGTWFISCLVWCYFIYPIVSLLISRDSFVIRTAILLLVGGLLLYSPFVDREFQTAGLYTNPYIRSMEFIVGIILAEYVKHDQELIALKRVAGKPIVLAILAIAYWYLITYLHTMNWGKGTYQLYNIFAVPAFSVALIGCSSIKSGKHGLSDKVISYLSKLSYCFYLAQLFSNWICKVILERLNLHLNNICLILVGWASCFSIALFLHEIVEKRAITTLLRAMDKKFGK